MTATLLLVTAFAFSAKKDKGSKKFSVKDRRVTALYLGK
jgi:hypothetical protein